MDIQGLVAQLKQEASRIERAIAALVGLDQTTPRQKKAGRKPMSPAMRKKLSRMMKARWAARKKR
jgi:hypothetical protein